MLGMLARVAGAPGGGIGVPGLFVVTDLVMGCCVAMVPCRLVMALGGIAMTLRAFAG